jgi:hypothetical protein
MRWILETLGVAVLGPVEAAWWPLLAALGRASQAALAGVYIILTMYLLRGYGFRRDVRSLPGLYRGVTVFFCLCALVCAGKALASGLSGRRLLSAPSVLAALFATAAASNLPRLTRARGTGAAAGGVPVAVAAAPANAKAPSGFPAARFETPEETARYTDWLLQKHEAVRELSDMLSAQEPPSGAATAAGAGAGLRPTVPAGNATSGPF